MHSLWRMSGIGMAIGVLLAAAALLGRPLVQGAVPPGADPPSGVPPGVAEVRPGRGPSNFPDAPIEIHFTRPMDARTVEAAFTIEPTVEGTFAWPSETHLRFSPARPFALGAEITVQLGAGMQEADGGEALAPFAWSFPILAEYSFAANVGPWVRRTCHECHGSEGVARAIPLAAYDDLAPFVVPGRAAGSRLIAALDDPTHRDALPAEVLARKAMLVEWIDASHAAP